MDASHPSRLSIRIVTALCAAIVLFTGSINVAGAQTAPADVPAAVAPAPAAPAAVAPAAADPIVVAQASPKPAPPAGGTATPRTPTNPAPPPSGGTAPTPVRPLPPLSHLPIIDFVVTFTQPAYYSSTPAVQAAIPSGGVNQLPAYDPIDLGGTVRIPVTRKLNLFFDRITNGPINQPLERSFLGPTPGTVVNFPRDTRDVILQYHATYAFDRFVSMDVGNSFRHRIWATAPGPNGTLNTISAQPFPYTLASQEHHFSYLGFTYTAKPWKEFLRSTFVFSETLDVQNVDHNVAILCTAAMIAGSLNQCAGRLPNQVGYLDENPGKAKYYETTQGISWIVPVDPRRGVSFLMNERWGYLNFYENTPQPYRWTTAFVTQLSKRFSPGFTLAMRHTDYHSSPTQGTPFTAPNVIHVGSWDLIGTFHVDTNTFFH